LDWIEGLQIALSYSPIELIRILPTIPDG